MVQIWKHDRWAAGSTDAWILNLPDFDHARFDKCQPIGDPFPETTIDIRSNAPPTDFFESGLMFLASERLKNILEEYRIPAEFFRVKVVHKKRPYRSPKIYCVNLLDQVDCLDRQLADYKTVRKPGYTHIVAHIGKLVIDETKTSGHHLFCLANALPYVLCVSEEVAARVRAENITGVKIVPPSEWVTFEWADD